MIGKTILHYKVLEKLGEGGMGVVYKAEDTKLDRIVAIKFLPKHIAHNSEERERFKIEAKAAASLSHSNVGHIYAIEEVEHDMFIVMEYIDGQELKEKIQSGPLPLEKAIDIAVRIGEGLQAAHEKDIVHRDIKSSNIMLTEKGQVKIMDFGLAKVRGVAKVTKEGTTLGTTTYMSPEQARGEQVDHRTDIWSLGIIIYEMVSGKLPFTGDYEQAVFYSIFNEEPEPLTSIRTGVSMEMERVVAKSLAKNPAERYQHIDEMLVDLKALKREQESGISKTRATVVEEKKSKSLLNNKIVWILAAVVVVLIVLLILFVPGKKQLIGNKSIAVLPFENINAGKESEYFSDGITEDIITQLSKIGNLNVVSRKSALRYKDSQKTMREIGEELGVRNILDGSIRSSGNRVRITAQLIDSQTDKYLWAETYDRDLKDIFAIQSDVAKQIATALSVTLSPTEEARIAQKQTENIDAYNLYLQGRFHWNKRTKDEIWKSIELFQNAIKLDPNYALAYSGLADAYSVLAGWWFEAPKDVFPNAKTAASKALELDENLAAGHLSLAFVQSLYDWDWHGAAESYQRALELDPKNAFAHYWYSLYLEAVGKSDEATTEVLQAQKLDPLVIQIQVGVGTHFAHIRQYNRAIKELKRALELNPNYYGAHHWLGWNYLALGKPAEALSEFSDAISASISVRAIALWQLGQKQEAMNLVTAIENSSSESVYMDPFFLAQFYAQIGETEKAFKWLERSYQERSFSFIWLRGNWLLDPLRSDPRFNDLYKRMGLEP